jgi:hypothetical protein
MNLRHCSLLLAAVPTLLAQNREPRTAPAVFHVDSGRGQDAADGLTPATAWRSLERVNRASLIPGDAVRFQRGGLWRGSLRPQSGSPQRRISYGAYGEGELPILQGSAARDAASDWEEVSPGVWATRKPAYTLGPSLLDLRRSEWSLHQESGAQVAIERGGEENQVRYRLTCSAAGSASNHLQLWGPLIAAELSPTVLIRLRLRCSVPFRPAGMQIMRRQAPWSGYRASAQNFCEVGEAWQTVDVILHGASVGDLPAPNLFLGGRLPAGAVFEVEPIGLWAATADREDNLAVDVGNIIFDHGPVCGVKKWRLEDLKTPGDYVYLGPSQQVLLRADGNPALRYRSIELALKEHIVSQGGIHDVTYEDLAVRYGAAHGFGGGGTARLTLRNCAVSFIGGAHQMTRADGVPVRYGNGIEFWNGGTDLLVEGCRLWEIYDAALTNQGSGADSRQINIVYRNNVIWNSEYSFEYWNRPATAVTENILFENNTCVDAGRGWAHGQRPDLNGAHLMFYSNVAKTRAFVVRNNIFCNSTEVCLRQDNDWRAELSVDHNLWYQESKPIVRFLVKQYYKADELDRYRLEVGFDAHSTVAAPLFVNAAARDYRLAPESPGRTLAHDGGRVGARPPE